MKKTFAAKLGAKDELLLELPFDPKEAFGRARAPVKVTLNGYAFRTTTSVMYGMNCIPVRKEHRRRAGVELGDRVKVEIEPDTKPRTVKVPPELAAELRKDEVARRAWKALSYTHKKEHADAIAQAKKPETRARRVRWAMEKLREADRR